MQLDRSTHTLLSWYQKKENPVSRDYRLGLVPPLKARWSCRWRKVHMLGVPTPFFKKLFILGQIGHVTAMQGARQCDPSKRWLLTDIGVSRHCRAIHLAGQHHPKDKFCELKRDPTTPLNGRWSPLHEQSDSGPVQRHIMFGDMGTGQPWQVSPSPKLQFFLVAAISLQRHAILLDCFPATSFNAKGVDWSWWICTRKMVKQ